MKNQLDTIEVPFNMVLVGQTHSGKTTLAKKLITNLKKEFDYIYIFCPTGELSQDWIEQEHLFTSPKEYGSKVKELFEQQKRIKLEYGKKRTPQILLVFDDCLTENILRFNSDLDKKSISTRHYNISVMVLSQRIAGIGRTFRLNSAYFILFNMFNYSELERFLDEFVPRKYKKQLEQQLESIFSEPYNFIFSNNRSTNLNERLYKNGIELLKFN